MDVRVRPGPSGRLCRMHPASEDDPANSGRSGRWLLVLSIASGLLVALWFARDLSIVGLLFCAIFMIPVVQRYRQFRRKAATPTPEGEPTRLVE